ncbi:MAG: adenylosuccinate lyase [Candidatus Neomarinimicrobiota bacterium]
MYNQLGALSPLDGRYANSVKELNVFFSEAAIMRYRVYIEIEYLIALSFEKKIKEFPALTKEQIENLRKIYRSFDMESAKHIKEIESETNHDVKAVEYYIQQKTNKSFHAWIHFALTSEDINNLSYSLMWQHGLNQVYIPVLKSVNNEIKKLAKRFKKAPMLSMTHGQPATPTTFGKELAVFHSRLNSKIHILKNQKLSGKLSGATGTWSAHLSAYPKVNWPRFSSRFIKSIGLRPNLITTQIEPHDSIVEGYQCVGHINSIMKDLCADMWLYISRGILGQKKVAGEVGSSTMPHKINPIQFENAEGNIGISNAMLTHLAEKLPISRMQRDLTDSTTLRNQGSALGYSFLALKNILKGLNRVTIHKNKMSAELDNHWEIVSEAIQTILRKSGQAKAYEQLKELTRGETVNRKILADYILELDIPKEDKDNLLSLTPQTYTGIAPKIFDLL